MQLDTIETSKTFKKEIAETAKSFLEESTSHGVPRIVKYAITKKWSLAIFWFILFVSSFSYCMYTIVNCFIIYYSFGITTTVSFCFLTFD
jgi:hypothetical protein